MFSVKDIAEYIVALIAAFASHYQMTVYDVMHTQSFDDMVQSMASYCRRNGGSL